MTSLWGEVRCAKARRWTSGIVAASYMVALAGCAEDRTSNADDQKPTAVTASGIEIVEVVENKDKRIVEAVVVTGGEERQVTFAPLLDGPFPSGLTARVHTSDDGKSIELSYGWDESTGATWVQQQAGGDTFALTRVVTAGRVIEDYAFNDRVLHVEYANLSPAVADKAVAKYLRGESLAGASPEVVEFAEQLQAVDAFAAQLPSSFTQENTDGQLVTAVLNHPDFANGLEKGDFETRSFIGALCTRFNQCTALFCRMLTSSQVCALCTAGSLACIALDMACAVLGCDCCFD